MSDTFNSRRGTRYSHAGSEIWSRRPTRYKMAGRDSEVVIRAAKRDTHRAERRAAKDQIRAELELDLAELWRDGLELVWLPGPSADELIEMIEIYHRAYPEVRKILYRS